LAFGLRARNTRAFKIVRANGDVKLHLVVEIAFKLGASQNRASRGPQSGSTYFDDSAPQ
jgi:hypothetical protein